MDRKSFQHPRETKTYRVLPEPRSFSNGFYTLLDVPRPGNDFSDEPLDDKDLSTLLHAIESKSQKREVGWSSWTWGNTPCVGVYLAKSNGLWYWEESKNAMLFVKAGEHFRKSVLPEHRIAQGAPVVLVFASRRESTSRSRGFERLCRLLHLSESLSIRHRTWIAALECGARIQNTLFAAQALQLQAEVVADLNREQVREVFDLTAKDDVFAAIAVGYKTANIFARKKR